MQSLVTAVIGSAAIVCIAVILSKPFLNWLDKRAKKDEDEGNTI